LTDLQQRCCVVFAHFSSSSSMVLQLLALDINGRCECCSSVIQNSVVAKGAEGGNGAEHAHSQHQ